MRVAREGFSFAGQSAWKLTATRHGQRQAEPGSWPPGEPGRQNLTGELAGTVRDAGQSGGGTPPFPWRVSAGGWQAGRSIPYASGGGSERGAPRGALREGQLLGWCLALVGPVLWSALRARPAERRLPRGEVWYASRTPYLGRPPSWFGTEHWHGKTVAAGCTGPEQARGGRANTTMSLRSPPPADAQAQPLGPDNRPGCPPYQRGSTQIRLGAKTGRRRPSLSGRLSPGREGDRRRGLAQPGVTPGGLAPKGATGPHEAGSVTPTFHGLW